LKNSGEQKVAIGIKLFLFSYGGGRFKIMVWMEGAKNLRTTPLCFRMVAERQKTHMEKENKQDVIFYIHMSKKNMYDVIKGFPKIPSTPYIYAILSNGQWRLKAPIGLIRTNL